MMEGTNGSRGEIDLEIEGDSAVITISNPRKRNALTRHMVHQLQATIDSLQDNKRVRAIVFQGAEAGFCAGSDLGERIEYRQNKAQHVNANDPYLDELGHLLRRVEELPVPTVAYIGRGPAVGAGMELALACDFRLATTTAQLGLPEARVGAIPGGGGTQRLMRLVGLTSANRLLLTGEIIDGTTAHQMCLITFAAESEKELAFILSETLRSVGRCAPLALQAIKRCQLEGGRGTLHQGLAIERQYALEIAGTKDREEGIMAFVEKRTPVFTGK